MQCLPVVLDSSIYMSNRCQYMGQTEMPLRVTRITLHGPAKQVLSEVVFSLTPGYFSHKLQQRRIVRVMLEQTQPDALRLSQLPGTKILDGCRKFFICH